MTSRFPKELQSPRHQGLTAVGASHLDNECPIPKPLEAPLSPHHASHPSQPDPVYWVTPRHLAGDDGELTERIGDTLTGLGWRVWPTSRHTLLYVSRDELRGAEWILASCPFELGGLPVALQLSARTHAASAMTEWNAYFTTGVPHEAVTDLLVALDARDMPDAGVMGPEAVLTATGPGQRSRTPLLLQRLPGDGAAPHPGRRSAP
ncbi:DUF317 domain-containing protein [Streptomyces regalis]|uniref:DUF317 domain-containing protein n=1 Tax=Streptomyces regalis TaxID=68262 RepID=UPI000A9FF1C5